MGTKNLIKTSAVNRVFPLEGGESFTALSDIQIEIPDKSLTILRGKSGSGKTTLLNILGALDVPTKGSVFMEEKEISAMTERDRELLRRKHMGYVFQSVSLLPMMTAYENVDFALRLAGSDEDRESRVRECLGRVGLVKRMHHMPQELSGGEQQRVAIARAIAHRPRVIFADEPTAELDSVSARSVLKLFRELIEAEGITIVMTTHDVSLMDAADVVYTLEEGKLCR